MNCMFQPSAQRPQLRVRPDHLQGGLEAVVRVQGQPALALRRGGGEGGSGVLNEKKRVAELLA